MASRREKGPGFKSQTAAGRKLRPQGVSGGGTLWGAGRWWEREPEGSGLEPRTQGTSTPVEMLMGQGDNSSPRGMGKPSARWLPRSALAPKSNPALPPPSRVALDKSLYLPESPCPHLQKRGQEQTELIACSQTK